MQINKIDEFLIKNIENQLNPLFKNITNITDIVINPNNYIYYYNKSRNIIKEICKIDLKSLYRTILMLACLYNKTINKDNPKLSVILPQTKFRMEVLISPVVDNISISIRIIDKSITSLNKLIDSKMITIEQKELLKTYIKNHKNIIIAGRTGCGKTTLLNSLINEIDNNERIIIIEDETKEIFTQKENIVNITTNNTLTGKAAIQSSLRMNPDRIIYGETRDGNSCLEMLKAWQTGHKGGLCTIHSNNSKETINRIISLLKEVTTQDMSYLINDTVDVIIYINLKNNIRIVSEILELKNATN